MRGEIIGVWSETWREIWSKLAKHNDAPDDLFCELYRELIVAFADQPDVTALADVIDDPLQAKEAFKRTKATAFQGEFAVVQFFERAQGTFNDLGGDPLSNRFFLLLEAFLNKFSLRYDLRRPLSLNPTLPGVFARLFKELKDATNRETDLRALMMEFEDAVRDLRVDSSSGRIKTCILKNLYGFASDYPGIRHAGTPANQLRDIEMRDLVAVSVMLAGFSPYLTDLIDSNIVYRGT